MSTQKYKQESTSSSNKQIAELYKDLKEHRTISIFLIITSVLPFIGLGSVYFLADLFNPEQSSLWIWLALGSGTVAGMTVGFIPASFTAAVLGYNFRSFECLPFILATYIISCIIGFYIAKLFDRNEFVDFISKKYNLDVHKEIASENKFFISLMRLTPVLPFAATNALFSLLNVDVRRYIFFSFLGMLPRTLIFTYVGIQAKEISELSNMTSGGWYKIIMIVLMLASLSLINTIFKRKIKAKRLEHEEKKLQTFSVDNDSGVNQP